MTYRVLLQPNAADEIDEIVGRIAADSPRNAAKWLGGLMKAISSLDILPHRHPLAPEGAYFQEEIRQFVYGRYRVLYTIDANTVRILHVRHGARRALGESEAEEPGT